ncbi:hypothetical protein [uncultured Hoeflea sp.]|uniref:hypothetical protein n=1 Tax=uncultured Hoeflea sp. TaxID=538666 RepID=UPI002616E66C|nr:hypothetical protein [uncultured Hoeflea sp.]
MISVSDILKLLDKIPQWKALGELPDRMAVMEERLAALEANSKSGDAPDPCPACGAQLAFKGERPDPVMGVVGIKERSFACADCGYTTERQWTAGDGYL